MATGRDALLGAFLMGLFGLGAATPMVMVMAAYASRAGFKRLRNWAIGNNRRLRIDFGLLAIVSGIILTGLDKLIATQAMAILPDSWLELITRY